jgi:hypothetical protein
VVFGIQHDNSFKVKFPLYDINIIIPTIDNTKIHSLINSLNKITKRQLGDVVQFNSHIQPLKPDKEYGAFVTYIATQQFKPNIINYLKSLKLEDYILANPYIIPEKIRQKINEGSCEYHSDLHLDEIMQVASSNQYGIQVDKNNWSRTLEIPSWSNRQFLLREVTNDFGMAMTITLIINGGMLVQDSRSLQTACNPHDGIIPPPHWLCPSCGSDRVHPGLELWCPECGYASGV